ncbi:butyrophilin-like protein 1 isoform X3 [Mastacembelus armatus]|uniref:butyrophilin-like protein 1 isoform X3 n=1 Tax=Mastacembelus armatus TaxID=205130 RepID=UPI000E4635DE|nr:butyrophilin-like protein 1 isoform X3 [Mastacembelus armatus]
MELLPVVCLCLLTWSGTTFAAGNGPDVIKMVVKEGDDAILSCSLSPRENIVQKLFDWKRDGQKEVFLYDAGVHYNNGRTGQDEQFRGRVSHFPDQLQFGDASIVIRNTKVTDSGNYTCDFPRPQPIRRGLIELVVGAAPEPSVTILEQTNDGVLLQCVVKGASPKPQLQWQDSGGNMVPAKDPQVTDRGGSYDIILQTTVTKTDHYRCVATQEEINHQVHAEIHVYNNGAAPKPSVTILEQTHDGVLLQCEVQGASPKPQLQWQDSGGNMVPAKDPQVTDRGGSYDIILQTTVTKTDHYRCVATQEEINHQVYAETLVNVTVFPTGWVVGAVIGTLFVVGVVLAVLGARGCIRCNGRGSVV